MTRKITSLLLVLVMALGLCVTTAWATEGADTGAATDITYRYYDADGQWQTETLTQDRYTLVTTETTAWDDGWYVVKSDVEINTNVQITGDNVSLILCDGATLTVNGIEANSKGLTIYACNENTDKMGKLIVKGYNTVDGDGRGDGHGINLVEGSLTVHGGNIAVTGKDATVTDTLCDSYGIKAHKLTVHGGKLEVTAGKPTVTGDDNRAGSYSRAIYLVSSTSGEEDNKTTTPAQFTVTGGEVCSTGGETAPLSEDCTSCGIYVHGGNMDISGGKVTAKGGKITFAGTSAPEGYTEYYSEGIFVTQNTIDGDSDVPGNVTITGGEVYAIGGDTNIGNSYGLYAGNSLTVSGANTVVSAKGGASSSANGMSVAIYVGLNVDKPQTFTVMGGTVTAEGGTATNSIGIYANILRIEGGAVTATGSAKTVLKGDLDSYGVRANSVAVSGGTLTAVGGNVSASGYEMYPDVETGEPKVYCLNTISNGIYATQVIVPAEDNEEEYVYIEGTGVITITGGTVTATGGTATVGGSFGSGDDGNCAYSYGMQTDVGITITGGTVNATGNTATSDMGETNSAGFNTNGGLTIRGGKVTATGDTHDILAWGNDIENGDNLLGVTVTGGTVQSNRDGNAMKVYARGKLTVTGGTIKLIDSELEGGVETSGGVKLADLLANGYCYYSVEYGYSGKERLTSVNLSGVRDNRIEGIVYVRPVEATHHRRSTATLSGAEENAQTVESPKTFDAGVALYGVMAVTSLLGMGYAGGKRR